MLERIKEFLEEENLVVRDHAGLEHTVYLTASYQGNSITYTELPDQSFSVTTQINGETRGKSGVNGGADLIDLTAKFVVDVKSLEIKKKVLAHATALKDDVCPEDKWM